MRITRIFIVTASAAAMVLSSWVLPVAGGQAFHVGLGFIDASATPPGFGYGFDPYSITSSENNFVTQGGLAGWTEDEARRAVALAVDDVLRDIDVGDSNRTVRMAAYIGPAPVGLAGQRLNVLLGQSSNPSYSILGETGGLYNYNDPRVNDTFVAAAYVDEIDKLGAGFLTYSTSAGAINAIAGTAAHELGHVLGAIHVSTAAEETPPLPIMATFQTGLAWEDRLNERRFSETLPAGTSNADLIAQIAGSVPLGDLNLDTLVDTDDWQIMVENWGLDDRLYQEGDVDGDQRIDARDAGIMFANWNGALPTSAAASAGIHALASDGPDFDGPSTFDALLHSGGIGVPEPACFMLAIIVLLAWLSGPREIRVLCR